MNSSASKRPQGVLFDTNVLSHFAKVERLPVLLQAFAALQQAKQLYIAPMIYQEVITGIQQGATYLQTALQLITAGEIQIVYPSKPTSNLCTASQPNLRLVRQRPLPSAIA